MKEGWFARDATPQPSVEYEVGLPSFSCAALVDAVEYVETHIADLQDAPPRIEIAQFLESRHGLTESRAV